METNMMVHVPLVPGMVPRIYHAAVVEGKELLIYGGYDGTSYHTDLKSYSLEKFTPEFIKTS